MLRITALSDFIGEISEKHLMATAAIATVLATTMEIAGRGPTRPLMVAITTCTVAALLLTLSFLVFASWNSVIVPRYGSSDLFLSVLLVVSGMMLWTLTVRGLTDEGSLHPVFVILGVVASLVASSLLAVLLPLAHKLYDWKS